MNTNWILLALIPLIVTSIFFLRNGLILLRRKSETPGAFYLGLMLFLVGCWLIFWMGEGLFQGKVWKQNAVMLQVSFIAFLLPSIVLYFSQINPLALFRSRRAATLLPFFLYLFPTLFVLLLWIQPGFFYDFPQMGGSGSPGWMSRVYGPLHPWYRYYSYGVTALLLPYMIYTLLKPEMRNFLGMRRLVVIFILAWTGDILHYFKVVAEPVPQLIFAYALAASLLVFSTKRYRIFMLPPTAILEIVKFWPQPLIILDEEKRILYANAKAGLLGLTQPNLIGLGPDQLGPEQASLAQLFRTPPKPRTTAEVSTPEHTFEARTARFPIGLFGFPGTMLYFGDITHRVKENQILERRIQDRTQELVELNLRLKEELEHRKRTEKDLFFFSVHDPLTGLVNRGYFQEELHRVMDRFTRSPEEHYAVIFVDFDGFKAINDTHGHQIGDQFLKEVAQRFRQSIRSSDTVARYGGDEFVILLTNLQSTLEALEVTERVLADLSIPMVLGKQRFVPSASLGLALGAASYASPDEVIRDADIAMYNAKAGGKGRISVYSPKMRDALLERAWIQEDLRTAMESGSIRLHFQPIVRMDTGEILGYEALVRCLDRRGQEIPPPLLVQTAEESGLSAPLGALILRRACETLVTLRKKKPELDKVYVSVNLEATQMTSKSFAALVARTLEETGLPAHLLHLEITETDIISDFEHVFPVLEALRTMGVHLKLDDFGTGYSSLNYLHRLPADCLKIDRSFVLEMTKEGGSAQDRGSAESIIRAIVALGKELGYEIIVEGVETLEQASQLKALGCEFAQGFYYSRPLSTTNLLDLRVPEKDLV